MCIIVIAWTEWTAAVDRINAMDQRWTGFTFVTAKCQSVNQILHLTARNVTQLTFELSVDKRVRCVTPFRQKRCATIRAKPASGLFVTPVSRTLLQLNKQR